MSLMGSLFVVPAEERTPIANPSGPCQCVGCKAQAAARHARRMRRALRFAEALGHPVLKHMLRVGRPRPGSQHDGPLPPLPPIPLLSVLPPLDVLVRQVAEREAQDTQERNTRAHTRATLRAQARSQTRRTQPPPLVSFLSRIRPL